MSWIELSGDDVIVDMDGDVTDDVSADMDIDFSFMAHLLIGPI